jgi:hypothetical protein
MILCIKCNKRAIKRPRVNLSRQTVYIDEETNVVVEIQNEGKINCVEGKKTEGGYAVG